MDDPHREGRRAIEEPVLRGVGHAKPELRQAAAARGQVPDDLRALVEKVHKHAYKVTDEEIAELRKRYSDDELFEVIVAAAVGAAGERLDRALRALEEAAS